MIWNVWVVRRAFCVIGKLMSCSCLCFDLRTGVQSDWTINTFFRSTALLILVSIQDCQVTHSTDSHLGRYHYTTSFTRNNPGICKGIFSLPATNKQDRGSKCFESESRFRVVFCASPTRSLGRLPKLPQSSEPPRRLVYHNPILHLLYPVRL
jgi:hypothetical protein